MGHANLTEKFWFCRKKSGLSPCIFLLHTVSLSCWCSIGLCRCTISSPSTVTHFLFKPNLWLSSKIEFTIISQYKPKYRYLLLKIVLICPIKFAKKKLPTKNALDPQLFIISKKCHKRKFSIEIYVMKN